MFPHFQENRLSAGGSPGNGMTVMRLSMDPLATEGEATPGPDDYNPYEEAEDRAFGAAFYRRDSPTEGDDPFTFDDVKAPTFDFGDFKPRKQSFSFDFDF